MKWDEFDPEKATKRIFLCPVLSIQLKWDAFRSGKLPEQIIICVLIRQFRWNGTHSCSRVIVFERIAAFYDLFVGHTAAAV